MSLTSSSKDMPPEKEEVSVLQDNNEIPSFLGLRGSKLHNAVAGMCGVGFLLFGYDQGVMSSLLTLGAFKDTFEVYRKGNPTMQSFIIAIYEIGCMVGALSTLYLGDKYGRVRLVFAGAFIMLIGGALQGCAYTVAHLIVARVVSGIGNGLITSTVPVWQAEIAKPEKRGKLIALQGAQITLGIAISYWIDFAFYFTDPSPAAWRVPVSLQCVFPLVILPLVLKLPESPRWLIRVRREEEGRRVFAALLEKPVDDYLVNQHMNEVEESLAAERALGGETFLMKRLFTQGEKRNFHRLCLAGWAQLMQQISGINLITYYAGTIFEKYIGIDPLPSRILAACNGTEYFLASLIPLWTIERFGRRPLLLIGTAGQCLSMVVLTITPKVSDNQGTSQPPAIAAAVFLFVFNSFFAIGMLSITWLYSPEVNSIEIRAPAAAISTACNWISNFAIVLITIPAFDNINSFTYLVFGMINFLMLPVIYFLFPETAGRSLEEMDLIFKQTPVWKPWQAVKIAREMPFIHAGAMEDIEEKRMAEFEHTEHAGLFEDNSITEKMSMKNDKNSI